MREFNGRVAVIPGATELAWRSQMALAVEGTANPGAGTLRVSAYAVVPIPALALA